MRLTVALVWLAFLGCLCATAAHAEIRVALVIGNGAYEHADKLVNPVTDARRMRDALTELGFQVTFGEDLGKQALERAIGRFAEAAQDADVALVFFAGHGATFGDTPYVVPIDARFSSLAAVPYELVPIEALIGELRRAKGLRIAILDACRDNAAERNLKRVAARGGEITRGLARVKNPEGLILAYATQYMSTAADGAPNGNSPFTAALLHNIATPGLDVKELFFRTGSEVIANTKGEQRPEISISFYDSYALVPAKPVMPNQPSLSILATDPCAAAGDHWRSAEAIGTREALEDHLARFPNCPFAGLARAKVEALKVAALAPAAAPGIPPLMPQAAVVSGAGAAPEYFVQVAAQKTEEEARSAYRALQVKYEKVFRARQPVIRRKDFGSKGVFYGVGIGPFSRGDAMEFCERLKSAGGSCMIQRYSDAVGIVR